MIADGLKTGDLIELRWRQRSFESRLFREDHENGFEIQFSQTSERWTKNITGWNCQVFYDSYQGSRRTKVPYNKHTMKSNGLNCVKDKAI